MIYYIIYKTYIACWYEKISRQTKLIFVNGYSFALLAILLKHKFQGKDRIRMYKKNNVKITSNSILGGEFPDITVSFEDGGTQYRFSGVYDGNRALSAKLLRLMENDENTLKGADKK